MQTRFSWKNSLSEGESQERLTVAGEGNTVNLNVQWKPALRPPPYYGNSVSHFLI